MVVKSLARLFARCQTLKCRAEFIPPIMEVVQATLEHVEGICQVWMPFIKYHRQFNSLFDLQDDALETFSNYVLEQIRDPNCLVVVAFVEARVVGFGTATIEMHPPVYLRPRHGMVTNLAVLRDFWNQGIGTAIMQEIYAWFNEHGASRIELHVVAQNAVGYAFWRKQGFTDYMHILYKHANAN